MNAQGLALSSLVLVLAGASSWPSYTCPDIKGPAQGCLCPSMSLDAQDPTTSLSSPTPVADERRQLDTCASAQVRIGRVREFLLVYKMTLLLSLFQ